MTMRALGFTLVGILFVTKAMAATQIQDVSKMVVADRAAARIARIASHTSNARLRAQEFEKLVDGEKNGNPSLTYGLAKYYREKWQQHMQKIGPVPSPLMNKIARNLSNRYHFPSIPSALAGMSPQYRQDYSYFVYYTKYIKKAAAENDSTAEASLASEYFWEPMRFAMLASYMSHKLHGSGNGGIVDEIMSEHALDGKVWAIMLQKSSYWAEQALKQGSPRALYKIPLNIMVLKKVFYGVEATNGFYCPELSNSVHRYTGITNISTRGGFIKSAKLGNIMAMYTVMCHFSVYKVNPYFLFNQLKTRLNYKSYGPSGLLNLLNQSQTPKAFCAAIKHGI